MARSAAACFAVALVLLSPSWVAATPPFSKRTSQQGLRGTSAPTAAGLRRNSSAGSSPAIKATAGQCTAADAEKMKTFGPGNAPGTLPRIIADCGKGSWNLFFGFNTGQYERCIVARTQISAPCASCFSVSGTYGYDNCKLQCLFTSWCGGPCLSCLAPAEAETKKCAGVPIPDVTQC
uniref:PSI domain-containing protein n=1 Tax=Alexandrium catenella TaxID=2925 RepID=A0A7S1RAD0_ALECA